MNILSLFCIEIIYTIYLEIVVQSTSSGCAPHSWYSCRPHDSLNQLAMWLAQETCCLSGSFAWRNSGYKTPRTELPTSAKHTRSAWAAPRGGKGVSNCLADVLGKVLDCAHFCMEGGACSGYCIAGTFRGRKLSRKQQAWRVREENFYGFVL